MSQFANDPQCVIEVSFNGDHFGAVNERLKQFAAGDLAGGQNDRGLDPARAAYAAADADVLPVDAQIMRRPLLQRFRNSDGHAAILERPGRIQSFVLNIYFAGPTGLAHRPTRSLSRGE